MKMIYAPEPLLGLNFLQSAPVTVEVLEHGEDFSLIRRPLAESTILNIIRKRDGRPPLGEIETRVLTKDLRHIQ